MLRYINPTKIGSVRLTHLCRVFISALFFVLMFLAQKVCAQTINIAWTADTNASVAGYDVCYGTSTGNYTSTVKVGKVTSAALTSMTANAYYIALAVYDSSGDKSGYSPELAVYSLNASAGTGGTISPSGSFYQSKGTSQTFTITPASGYHVAKVTVDGVSVGAPTSYTLSDITTSHTIAATFSNAAYTISASISGSNGSISPSGSVSASAGSTQTFTVTPSTGYTASVGGTCGGTLSGGKYTTKAIDANCTVTASFTLKSFTVTPSAGSGGKLGPSTPQTVSYDHTTSFTVTPNTGYGISSVTGCGGTLSRSEYTTGLITGNCTVTATFSQTHGIFASSGPNGAISPSGTVHANAGASQSFSITPAKGYEVASVGVDGVSVGAVTSYKFSDIAASHTISASFQPVAVPPVADAGPNRIRTDGVKVTLEAANSTDEKGPGIASYKWTQTGGTPVSILQPSSSQTGLNVTSQLGALNFQLTVTDKNGLKSTSGCIVNAVTADMPPTANAGPDQTVSGYTIVTLNGSQSTAARPGYITSYKWRQIDGPAVTISNSTSSHATIVAPEPATGNASLGFMLTVTDNNGLQSTDICFVNVSPEESGPKAVVGATQTVQAMAAVHLKGSSSTASNGIASYRWHQTGGQPVTLSNPASANPSFTSPRYGVQYGNTLTFRLIIQDTAGLRSRATQIVNFE
jgi:hypothetical protein